MFSKESLKEKFALPYIIVSGIAVLFTIAITIITIIKYIPVLVFIYLGLVLLYALTLLIFEIIKLKSEQKEEEK